MSRKFEKKQAVIGGWKRGSHIELKHRKEMRHEIPYLIYIYNNMVINFTNN